MWGKKEGKKMGKEWKNERKKWTYAGITMRKKWVSGQKCTKETPELGLWGMRQSSPSRNRQNEAERPWQVTQRHK